MGNVTMASFLDQIAPDTGTAMDPLTGLPRVPKPQSGPYDYSAPGQDSMPAAAAPASPAAAAGPTTSPMATSTRDDLLSGNEPGLNPAAISMGADAGDEVSVASRSFVADPRTRAYAPQGSAQGNAIDAIHAAQPNAQVFAAKNYNRVGGQDASQFMAGMSPAAQAAIQKLMSPRPDATATFNGQSFVMPGGNFVPAGAAMRAAQGADAQTAQAQELDQRAKADAYKQANSPAALEQQRAENQRKTFLAEHPPAAPPVPGTMADLQLQEEQEKLKALQRGNQPAVQPSPAYGDAQRVIGQLDPTNPQHVPVINALRGMKPTDLQAPQIPMQQAGQLLHPTAPEGKQRSQAVQTAQQQIATNPLVSQPLQEVMSQMKDTGVTDQNRDYLNQRLESAVQEAVRNGADEGTVRQIIQQNMHSQFPSAFTPESPVNSGISTFLKYTSGAGGWIPSYFQGRQQAANKSMASFIDDPRDQNHG